MTLTWAWRVHHLIYERHTCLGNELQSLQQTAKRNILLNPVTESPRCVRVEAHEQALTLLPPSTYPRKDYLPRCDSQASRAPMLQAFCSTEYIWPDAHRQQPQLHNDLSLPDLYAAGDIIRCPHAFTAENLLKAVTWLHASTIGCVSLQRGHASTHVSVTPLPHLLHLYLHLDFFAR